MVQFLRCVCVYEYVAKILISDLMSQESIHSELKVIPIYGRNTGL